MRGNNYYSGPPLLHSELTRLSSTLEILENVTMRELILNAPKEDDEFEVDTKLVEYSKDEIYIALEIFKNDHYQDTEQHTINRHTMKVVK